MLDGVLKHRAGPTKTVARVEQAIDLRSVPRPLLDLVEVAPVGVGRATPVATIVRGAMSKVLVDALLSQK
jgi:hypothetical protein